MNLFYVGKESKVINRFGDKVKSVFRLWDYVLRRFMDFNNVCKFCWVIIYVVYLLMIVSDLMES